VRTYIQHLVQSDAGSCGITMVSVWTLIQQLAQALHTFCGSMVQDRWWPADCPPPDPYTGTLPNDVRYKADAPGLSVRVRVTWQPNRHDPPLKEWFRTFEDLPTFQARVDESPSDLQRFLLVEFDTPPQCATEEWKQACLAPTQDQWDALQKTRKFLKLRVGLGDQYKEWSPQDKALWQALKLQKVLRDVDRTRRNPTAPSPREAMVQVLEQGLQHTATNPALRYVVEETLIELGALPPDWDPWRGARHPEGLRAVYYILPPGSGREPLSWLPLWTEPGITTLDDTMFELVLRVLQWGMIESTSAINRFLDRFMRQYKYAFTKDERRRLRQGIELCGGEGFAEILRTNAYPESAKGIHQHIARTLHGRRATAARQEAEQSGQGLAVAPRSDGRYSVDDAVRILAREAHAGQWTPPRDWLYDQINTGTLPVVCNKWLDENGLQCARKLVKDKTLRETLVEYQTQWKSRRAANKYIQEHEARGESLEDIAKALRSQQRGSPT